MQYHKNGCEEKSGLRIDPYQKARAMEKAGNRKLKMVSERVGEAQEC